MVAVPNTFDIEIIRSARRTRTAAGRIVDGRIQVRVPANLLPHEEAQLVDDIVAKINRKTTATARTDADLTRRAQVLNRTVLDGQATIGSVRWVTNQSQRWGSCSPATGTFGFPTGCGTYPIMCWIRCWCMSSPTRLSTMGIPPIFGRGRTKHPALNGPKGFWRRGVG